MGINFPNVPGEGSRIASPKTQWVYSNGAWRASPVGTARPFNYLINPSFQISAQNGNTAGTTTAYYPADQWWPEFNGAMVITSQRVQVPTPNGSPNRLRLTVTTADTSLAATDHFQLIQRLEGQRIAPFLWGAGGSYPIVVRFGFKGPAGTYTMVCINGGLTTSYIAPFTISAAQANTDTVQTFSIPPPAGGSWPTDTALGMQFCLWFCSGTTYHGVAGWNTAHVYYTAAGSNGVAVAGAVFEVFDFGMYGDPLGTGVAPPWEQTPIRQDVFDCQRHWHRCFSAIGIAIANTTTHQRASYPNQAPMRIVPATALVGVMRAWDQALVPTITAIANSYSNYAVDEFNFTSNAAQTMGRAAMLIDTSGSVYVAHNARS